jgi:hypothetical protein
MAASNPRDATVAENRHQQLLVTPAAKTCILGRHDAHRLRIFDADSHLYAHCRRCRPFVRHAQPVDTSTVHLQGKQLIMTNHNLSGKRSNWAGRNDSISALISLTLVAAALSGCQSTPATKGAPNAMLTNAGFVAKRATTPEQIAVLNNMPQGKFVRQTANGKSTYLYADQAGCGCIHAGDQSAFQSFKGMQNIMYDMNRSEFGGGLDPSNIGDLSDWEPY